MKCTSCHNKQTSWGLGFCKKCGASTPSSGYRYCDKCAEELDQCQVCGTGLSDQDSSSPVQSGPSPFITKLAARDNGKTVGGLRSAELVEITLDEDQYSGKEWAVKTHDWQFSVVKNGEFTQNPQNPQYGSRSFVFRCDNPGIGEIELHEVTRSYGYGFGGGRGGSPAPGGSTYMVTVEVN